MKVRKDELLIKPGSVVIDYLCFDVAVEEVAIDAHEMKVQDASNEAFSVFRMKPSIGEAEGQKSIILSIRSLTSPSNHSNNRFYCEVLVSDPSINLTLDFAIAAG